ncbi:MAG: hypothetical protein AAF546_07910 [Verrucomicrobiota bacterium]
METRIKGKAILKYLLLVLFGHGLGNLALTIISPSPSVFIEASIGAVLGLFVLASGCMVSYAATAAIFSIAFALSLAGWIIGKKIKKRRIFECSITISAAIVSFWLSINGLSAMYF